MGEDEAVRDRETAHPAHLAERWLAESYELRATSPRESEKKDGHAASAAAPAPAPDESRDALAADRRAFLVAPGVER
jgi:hypothetical protein